MARKLKKKGKSKDSQRSIIAYLDPKSPISEQYRTIRTSIQLTAVKDEMNIISITSALPGEGKSTTASNLAIVLAQQEYKVLLIDADMRRPSCHHNFLLDNRYGLTNVLLKLSELSEVISNSSIPNLQILTAGPIPPNPAELLSMKRMDWLLNEARENYDYIIIDTPPVLSVTDALILAQKSDGIVLVAGTGKTTKESVVKAKELLIQTSGKLLGVVLNRMNKLSNKKQGYYYGVYQ